MKPKTRARLLGLAVVTAGLLDVGSALTPELRSRLADMRGFITPYVSRFASGAAAILGVILILLGRGIMQRRRIAFSAALVLLLLTMAAHVIKGLDVEEAGFTLFLLIVLVWNRRLFTIGYESTRWRTVAGVIPTIVALDLGYGVIGLVLRHRSVHPSLSPSGVLREIFSRNVGLQGPYEITGRFGHWFPASLTVLGGISIGLVVAAILKPVADTAVGQHLLSSERERIRKMIQRPDGDTLDFFALRRDKRYVFSADGRAAVAYRYFNGVGLASGDPIGEPSSFPSAVARFVAQCDDHGWRPAVLGARETHVPLWESAGLRSVYLGDEAIIDVPTFSLEGRKFRNVRQSASHTYSEGVTTEVVREGDIQESDRAILREVADRARKGAPERGFSMALGGILNGEEPDCTVIIARDANGRPCGFQRYVPCKLGRVLSLDVMRRDPTDSPNGLNERMIIDLIEWARAHDIVEVSLNFAAFRGLIEAEDLPLSRAAGAWFIKKIGPYFQMQSLHWFNKKFRPRWVPRFLMYRSVADFAAVGIASLSAEQLLSRERAQDLAGIAQGN
ncbi:MAG: bifunctional lysylphosphatidylglycerol flippase/synthetase MprF [Actinomycetota bacterium]|nr:phosphatidylglycerol lysyltransferase domain-containing protein [Actinomycetota bacterium]